MAFTVTTLSFRDGQSIPAEFTCDGHDTLPAIASPCPPRGRGPHRYYFTVYAVDVPALDLSGGTRADLEAALEAHTLGTGTFMGRCERR